jgi:hypothetical protein
MNTSAETTRRFTSRKELELAELNMTLVVIAKNSKDMTGFHRDYTYEVSDLVSVINYRNEGLASIANRYLYTSKSDVFGLCHADTYFNDGSLRIFHDCSVGGAVCGVVGQADRFKDPHSIVWSHQWGSPSESQLESGWPRSTTGPCPVSTLDCCGIFFPRLSGLKFDEVTFDSFHCHAEDLCLQAHNYGMRVVVPAAKTGHGSPVPNDSNWGAQRDVYYGRLKAKWKNVFTWRRCF